MSTTPTPRTDAESKRQEQWADEVHADTFDCWRETFKFARQLETELAAMTRERNELKAALEKINIIRNSIIAHQSCNFSEHVYPLVAALNEAGIKGMPYPEALAYFGPVTERAAKAETDKATLVEALKRFRAYDDAKQALQQVGVKLE